MSILDYFTKWKVTVTPITITQAPDPDTGIWGDTPVDGTPVKGVLYNRSDAERYYSQTWASDVSDVFVTDDVTELTPDSNVRYGSRTYSVESVVNVGNQDNAWTVGLKVIV